MTPDGTRLSDGHGRGHSSPDDDLIAALWEQVPFPRLPHDAPPELKEFVVKLENPKSVYAVHRASRRHGFQLLVEKFILQLRHGCGYENCPTPSCFKCRKRLAGKAPIRRYSPTSARTLAVYMASQDNPESQLCPYLQQPKGPSDAIKPLKFAPSPFGSLLRDLRDGTAPKHPNGRANGAPNAKEPARLKPVVSSPKSPRSSPRDGSRTQGEDSHEESKGPEPTPSSATPELLIVERDIRKDYRSFAANLVETVGFRMLEWLTPNNIEAMSKKAKKTLGKLGKDGSMDITDNESADEDEEGLFVPSASLSDAADETNSTPATTPSSGNVAIQPQHEVTDHGDIGKGSEREPALPSSQTRPVNSRQNSSARVRKSSISMAPPRLPNEPLSESATDEALAARLGPRAKAFDTSLKNALRSPASRPLQSRDDKSLHTITDEQSATNQYNHTNRRDKNTNEEDVLNVDETLASVDTAPGPGETELEDEDVKNNAKLDNLLPQSLSILSLDMVNLLCDVLQEDGTAEPHMLEPLAVSKCLKRSPPKGTPWKRRRRSQTSYPRNLKVEWKLFAEQSIFHVLRDPHAILESFTDRNGFVDSQSLWYSMFRMTRVAPALVFDSLWSASASLFALPKPLQSSKSSTAKAFLQQGQPLTNKEAGCLLSVCFHALVAAAPLATDPRQIIDMSRIRSRGLILAESGAVARQPSSLCLQYEDAFTDALALRLARRLLAAIPTRQYFDELIDQRMRNDAIDPDTAESLRSQVWPGTVEALLSHLEFPDGEAQTLLDFSHAERELHEKRVPILLLDWARTVMLHEWDGKPVVCGDGPFGGALKLIEAMHLKRSSLLLSDNAFRTEYFEDRLDTIEMPVSWLTFNSTKRKMHLLDSPYMFSPSALVTYFRAINFSRMSRSYEESSSLQSRVNAIIAHDSLVTDSHQRSMLQDLLKTPQAKFLILDIGRSTVLRDAFDQLWRREERELMRPLKVHLGEDTGEEGFDSGGVQQEFFRMAIVEALNPDYGAFTVDERTRMLWFKPGPLQPEWKFELIGLLMSLAVYNGLTLPVTFPKALYRKILDKPVNELYHIEDGWPELASGLTTLLEWDEKDGAVEDVFALTYEFSIDMFGKPVSRQMEASKKTASWPEFSHHPAAESLWSSNPEDAPLVTADNRDVYVADYIHYLTHVSVAPQFEAFARGFRTCLRAKSLQLLTPSLLQSVVEGTQDIDVAELRRAARYVGWDAGHPAIRDFWSIVKRYDDGMKRKLLEFVTASDRVPVGGMRNIQFVVQKNGEEEGEAGHLPTAYTCYGILLLPEYRDKEVLRQRLAMALENAQGFGFA